MSSQQEHWHPNRKSETQQKDLPRKEDSLRKCLPNKKTDTQTANQKPNRGIAVRNVPSVRLDKSLQIRDLIPPKIFAVRDLKSLCKTLSKFSIRQIPSKDRHRNSNSHTQQADLPQKGDSPPLKEESLRTCLPNGKTDTQTGNYEPNRKNFPRIEDSLRKCLPTRKTDTLNRKSRTQLFQQVDLHAVRDEELGRKTCSLQKVHSPKSKSRSQQRPPRERRLVKKFVAQQVEPHQIKNPTDRLARERRVIKKFVPQQVDNRPKSKSRTQQTDLPEKVGVLRNLSSNR